MEIRAIEDATFGATVTGVRLAALGAADWQALYRAWLRYALLIFPGQHLSNAEQIAFARRFGPIERIGSGDIVAISNVDAAGRVRSCEPAEWDDMMKIIVGNMSWHADSTYMPVMAKGAVFSAEVVPPARGETSFADMRAAYDALDAPTRELVEQRAAHHSLKYSQSKLGHVHRDGSAYVGYGMTEERAPLRPLVKVHPETGRRSLLIGRHAHAIPGMTFEDSERFLEELVEWACQPPRVVTHRWRAGDAVLWDNRCLLHRAMPWDMSQPRVMWHSRLRGDEVSEAALPA
ncbi:MAG: TauD/TfdA family dioxygenase [Burkholderiales bacterium]|nr:TauD/TfdA family dioxygenase [Burkholderiales bacterium]